MVPSFPPDELETEEELVSGLRSGRSRVLVAVGTDGNVLGGAVGEYFPRSRVMLLAYLAVLPGGRGGGVGSAVLRAARDA
jgi:predicted N-acetyltransferase YhbS